MVEVQNATATASPILALAIFDAMPSALIVIEPNGRIIAANLAFSRLFDIPQATLQEADFWTLGGADWDTPSLRIFIERAASESAVEDTYLFSQTFERIGHHDFRLTAGKISIGGAGAEAPLQDCVVIAIVDETERLRIDRERDELIRQKDFLLQELQHRISNSLQIIASILLLKAGTVSSEETRVHLRDAHQRVLAVASLQRAIDAANGARSIPLRAYLLRLCECLENAMIAPERMIKLEVKIDEVDAPAVQATSLGLIVTELVINALKHAFPVDAPGHVITVSLTAMQDLWRLGVRDNGVGNSGDHAPSHKGLGTNIVTALAMQLGATVQRDFSATGADISLTFPAPSP